MQTSRQRLFFGVAVAAVICVAVAIGVIELRRTGQTLPGPGTPLYEDYAEAFEVGTAGLDVDRPDIAQSNLDRAIEKIPQDPAAWANRGLLHLRQNRLDDAAKDLGKAQSLAPDSPEIEELLGLLADARGQFDAAVAHLRKAIAAKPQNLAAQFKLAQLVEKAAAADSEAEYQKILDGVLQIQPNNLKALVERAKVAQRRRDANGMRDALARFDKLALNWRAESRTQLGTLKTAV